MDISNQTEHNRK